MADTIARHGEKRRRVRPLPLEYAERVPLEERQGRYDEVREVWVVEDKSGEAPLIRAHGAVLEDTVTKRQTDPNDPSRPRRGSSYVPGRHLSWADGAALGDTETRVPADPTDPGRPRRGAGKFAGRAQTSEDTRVVLGATKTGVPVDPADRPRPRRAGVQRQAPEEGHAAADDEGAGESHSRGTAR